MDMAGDGDSRAAVVAHAATLAPAILTVQSITCAVVAISSSSALAQPVPLRTARPSSYGTPLRKPVFPADPGHTWLPRLLSASVTKERPGTTRPTLA